jgi:hypothetical protein
LAVGSTSRILRRAAPELAIRISATAATEQVYSTGRPQQAHAPGNRRSFMVRRLVPQGLSAPCRGEVIRDVGQRVASRKTVIFSDSEKTVEFMTRLPAIRRRFELAGLNTAPSPCYERESAERSEDD